MNNLYNEEDVTSILERVKNLSPNNTKQWGKMNIAQMLAHLNESLETALGLNFPKRMFIGKIIGGIFKKKALNEKPLDRNSPTDKNYIFTDKREFEKEKAKSIVLIKTFYENGSAKCTTHPHSFFGKMTANEWSVLQWKHFDHHLRQFDA
jgi:Protein of unknown function (DUF1569)